VLIRNRTQFPQPRTYLAVVDALRLRIERPLTLRGDFSFDAISPDGSTIYLINYLSSRDPTKYAVRAFDVARGELLPGAIRDPHEPGEQMQGLPITRSTSPDGRWAYTLYAGSDHPFVHALDTAGRTARCIDVNVLAARQDLFSLRMKTAPGGGRLTIASKEGEPLALLDTRTFRVSAPVSPHAPATRQPAPADSGRPWLVPAAIALLLLLLTGAGYAGRNRMLARAARAR
jgi:DNA-binding beta-propeller fold protein YncE